MFIKPFKIKSNIQLKGSDIKKFRLRIEQNFPNLNEIDIQNLLPTKSILNHIKIITNTNISCMIYSVEKRPLFFEYENNQLIPTVYALWLAEDILPYFTTHTAVLPKLVNGADLMLPGVIRKGDGMNAYGRYKKDQLVAVNLTSNKSGVGVGRLARSSDDLYMAAGHGVCVKMLHVFGDKLWNLEPTVTMQIPENKPVFELAKDDEFPELGSTVKNKTPSKQQLEKTLENSSLEDKFEKSCGVVNEYETNENELDNDSNKCMKNENNLENLRNCEDNDDTDDDHQDNLDDGNENGEVGIASSTDEKQEENNMDTILKNAFLKVIKFDGKSLSLPLLTSNFYRLHIMPAATKQIDLKQTSYKKISKFLNEMEKQGFIKVNEEAKGIEKITSINHDHEEIINFQLRDINSINDNDSKNKDVQLFHSKMTELYLVTDDTIKFFTKFNYKQGDGIQAIQIKKLIKEYISKNHLETIKNTKIIKLDSILSEICDTDGSNLEQIYSSVMDKMHHKFEMRDNYMNAINVHNKQPIQLSMATRSGNKKVTLISNLELYGIIIPEFSKLCKIGAAASTSIVKTPNQKYDQLQIQGNQIRFVHNLLTEKYKIPLKQIIGLDLAKKEKKKKK